MLLAFCSFPEAMLHCRLDAVSLAAACWQTDVLKMLHKHFPALSLQDSAQPFAAVGLCKKADLAGSSKEAAYEAHSGRINDTIKHLLDWLHEEGLTMEALAACIDHTTPEGLTALQHLVTASNTQ